MKNFKHLIEIDKGKLIIYRIFDNGTKELFTETALPDINAGDDGDAFAKFSQQLGENVLMDSPLARKKFYL